MSTATADATTSPMEEYLQNAIHVMDSVKGVDPQTVKSCVAILLISTKEKGLVFSVDRGTGVLLLNNKEGGWSSPVAVRLDSHGVGAVFGYAKKDVLIVLRQESVDKLLKGGSELILGWDFGFACGKKGGATGPDITDRDRDGVTSTSYVYTFSEGALISIETADGKIKIVPEVNTAFYGDGTTTEDIVSGKTSVPEGQGDLIATLKAKIDEYANKTK